jgi:hypothetical protein
MPNRAPVKAPALTVPTVEPLLSLVAAQVLAERGPRRRDGEQAVARPAWPAVADGGMRLGWGRDRPQALGASLHLARLPAARGGDGGV